MAEKQRPTVELRELSDADLTKALEEAYRELFNLRMRHATRQLEKHHVLRQARKRIARIKTIQSERRLGIQRG